MLFFLYFFLHFSIGSLEQFSIGRPCKLFPRTPQWGSRGEFANHRVQLVTALTWHFYSLRRMEKVLRRKKGYKSHPFCKQPLSADRLSEHNTAGSPESLKNSIIN